MTGPEHYDNAESDLDHAARASDKGQQDDVTYWLGCAQAHATLALADFFRAWTEVATR
jgi:hypothetical protein